MARSFFLMMPCLMLVVACGKFASDPWLSHVSPTANPLKAEQEDLIKLNAKKEVPKDVAALFSKERKQSDAALSNSQSNSSQSNSMLIAGAPDARLISAVSSIERMNGVVSKRRTEMLRIMDLMAKGKSLSATESSWLVALSNEFRAKSGNLEDLRSRVDVWPPSFILASAFVLGQSWPTEAQLSDRISVLNSSAKPELASVRALRARLSSDSSKSEIEKSRALVEELTKTLDPSVKADMLKTVVDISAALPSAALPSKFAGVKP